MSNDNWPLTLREFRAARGISQAKLAAALEVDVETVKNWESGRRNPSPLRKLARELERIGRKYPITGAPSGAGVA